MTAKTVTRNGKTVTIETTWEITQIIDTLYIDLDMTEEEADALAFRLVNGRR